MSKASSDIRAMVINPKLDIHGLDNRIEFGRRVSQLAKSDPQLFGNLFHELDALLPIVSSKKIDYAALITRPVKPTYPPAPTLESLPAIKTDESDVTSSTSFVVADRTAELAFAMERYENDVLPDYSEEKKRYHKRLQLIEDHDANLFTLIWNNLSTASIDRLTREYLQEYSKTSAPNPSGVALFKLLMITHKPTDQAAMLARTEMWNDLVAFKQSRTMAMETYINGFMLLHQKLVDVDYKVDEAALVNVFVNNMNRDKFGSTFHILRMATPVGDIGTAFKVASHAAEQVRLQKPDLNRVTSHSANYADDKMTKTFSPRGRPSGSERSTSPRGAKRASTPPRKSSLSSTSSRSLADSKSSAKKFDPAVNCGYCWRTLKRICTHMESDCRKKSVSFAGMAIGSSFTEASLSHVTSSSTRCSRPSGLPQSRQFPPPRQRPVVFEQPRQRPVVFEQPRQRALNGHYDHRSRARSYARQNLSRNSSHHRPLHSALRPSQGERPAFIRCHPQHNHGPSLNHSAFRRQCTATPVVGSTTRNFATRAGTRPFERNIGYRHAAHANNQDRIRFPRESSRPSPRLMNHPHPRSPYDHRHRGSLPRNVVHPQSASSFPITVQVSLCIPRLLQQPEPARGVLRYHVAYTVTTALVSFATKSVCPRIILDSGATVSIVNDLALLHSVHRVHPVTVHGVGGTSSSTLAGELGLYGPALYLPGCPQNILSTAVLMDHSGWVQCELDPDNPPFERMRVTAFSHGDVIFTRHGGLYFSEFPAAWCNPGGDLVMDHAPLRALTPTAPVFPAVAVYGSELPVNYTLPELDRAQVAGRLHRSLHHPCDQYLSTALDHGVMVGTGVTSKDLRNYRVIYGPCKGCLLGKSRQPSSLSPSSTSYEIGELLVMDIFFFYGIAGKKEPYLLSVESRTGHLLVSRMANKTLSTLIAVITRFLSFYSGRGFAVKIVRTDRETSLLACESSLHAFGVAMQRTGTASHAKQAERAIQTIKSRCRATKSSLGFDLPRSLHQYLVMDVVAALNDCVNSNCTPSTPSIIITGSRPSFTNHYGVPFGSVGIAKTPPNHERDDQPRAALVMCVGRDRGSQKALKVLVLSTQRVIHVNSFKALDLTRDVIDRMDDITSRDVDIGEDLLGEEDVLHPADPSEPTVIEIADHQDFDDEFLDEHLVPVVPDESLFIPGALIPAAPAIAPLLPQPVVDLVPVQLEPAEQAQPAEEMFLPAPLLPSPPAAQPARKPRVPRVAKPTDRVTRSTTARNALADLNASAFNLTITEAATDHGPEVVKVAISDELRSLVEETRALVPCFTREKQFPMHLLLKHKYNAELVFEKCKARLVIGGNLQHRDEDIDTSSFCVRVQSILLLLGLAYIDKLRVHAVDIKTAYLHADVKSRVYGRMPKKVVPYLLELYPEMKEFLNRDGSMSFKVEKAVYGLAEASRLWFLHLTSLLSKLGYATSANDKGVLYRMTPDGPVFILLHVDDMLVLSCNDKYWEELKTYFRAHLRGITAQEGPIISFVGLLIHQHTDHISVDRRGYIDKLHSKRDPADIPRAKVIYPLALNAIQPMPTASIALPPHSLSSEIMELRYVDDVRPDIKFATSHLTMNMSKPSTSLAKDSKHLLSYLHGTKQLSIRICPSTDQIRAYVDASYAIHPGSRSHYGVALCLGEQGYCFHAKSSAIKVVCRSSTEAELHAANEACSDVLHAIDLLTELGHPQGPVPFYEDNMAVIQLMVKSDFNFQTKSKHVRVRYDFLKEQVREGKIVFVYLPTDLQLADILTKPLLGEKFIYFRDSLLGVVPHKPYPTAVG